MRDSKTTKFSSNKAQDEVGEYHGDNKDRASNWNYGNRDDRSV